MTTRMPRIASKTAILSVNGQGVDARYPVAKPNGFGNGAPGAMV